EAAKQATQQVLAEGDADLAVTPLGPSLDHLAPGGYLAVQAFVDPGGDLAPALRQATFALGQHLGVAATFGLGPRYLHSTGQLHKGGPPTGVFIQVVGDDPRDVEIPGAGYSFGRLKAAQAAGDLTALRSRGLPVARVRPDDLLEMGR
ncbi:MAG: glucose-6-phosphate isomerase, partial [Actinobacteria bacterium]|nr:glucose-6-phosphate isomerase [Actinomycetota bacterium]